MAIIETPKHLYSDTPPTILRNREEKKETTNFLTISLNEQLKCPEIHWKSGGSESGAGRFPEGE